MNDKPDSWRKCRDTNCSDCQGNSSRTKSPGNKYKRYGDVDTIQEMITSMVMSVSAISLKGRLSCVSDLISDHCWEDLRNMTVEDIIITLEEGHYE